MKLQLVNRTAICLAAVLFVACGHYKEVAASPEMSEGGCYQLAPHEGKPPPSPVPASCAAVLRNFNQYCSEPPPYDRVKIHATTKDLSEPAWEPMEARESLAKAVWTFSRPEEYREGDWVANRSAVMSELETGSMRLFKADLDTTGDVDRVGALQGALLTVFRLQPSASTPESGFRQARHMFSDAGKESPSSRFVYANIFSRGELWNYKRDWLIVRYHTSSDAFEVRQFIRPYVELTAPVGVRHLCDIKHTSDVSQE